MARLPIVLSKLADVYLKSQQVRQAQNALEAGRAVVARMIAERPNMPQLQQDLAWFDQQVAALKH
jgi:hypothetical protein